MSASYITLRREFRSLNLFKHSPRRPDQMVAKYADALSIALLFFDVQKSGKLEKSRISWRGDSGLEDGKEEKLDMSKGLYDAGNNVGDPEFDHKCWQRPEVAALPRPLMQVNSSYPGSNVAAETAVAMASTSLVFRSTHLAYSRLLLKHARQLFVFADTYKGSCSDSLPQVQNYYNTSGYGDKLLWAAACVYHATGGMAYLQYATVQGNYFTDWGAKTWFSWDNKLTGTQVLLSRVSFFKSRSIRVEESITLQLYKRTAELVVCGLLPNSSSASQRTEGLLSKRTQY
ncbi:cellulase [Salvia divinorum]|uniref:cellulase n=1 Tax=Salvia divinorum TaxID=28513 RepID=A0ABD1FYB0_SALDI